MSSLSREGGGPRPGIRAAHSLMARTRSICGSPTLTSIAPAPLRPEASLLARRRPTVPGGVVFNGGLAGDVDPLADGQKGLSDGRR
jgi:hypothetical protein